MKLLRIAMNVSDPTRASQFYRDALGFTAMAPTRLGYGAQQIELTAPHEPGAPMPPDSTACDLWFQHFAIIVTDIADAWARLRRHGATPITQGAPVGLPASSGGVTCYKFRDPDGHPLELIAGDIPRIDHSAISVADADRSIAFYAATLGLVPGQRQVNSGPAQDLLDGLPGVVVDVVALTTADGPHVELLGYRSPRGRPAELRQNDIAATRLVFAGSSAAVLRDPDGHFLVTEPADAAAPRGA